jgi:hypothetical protein
MAVSRTPRTSLPEQTFSNARMPASSSTGVSCSGILGGRSFAIGDPRNPLLVDPPGEELLKRPEPYARRRRRARGEEVGDGVRDLVP